MMVERYKQFFEDSKYIDFSKDRDYIELLGNLKGKDYSITMQWSGPKQGFNVECSIVTSQGSEFIYGKNSNIHGGSVEQTLTPIFINIFKISVPKIENGGSGLDVNHMIETLIKKYKFKVK